MKNMDKRDCVFAVVLLLLALGAVAYLVLMKSAQKEDTEITEVTEIAITDGEPLKNDADNPAGPWPGTNASSRPKSPKDSPTNSSSYSYEQYREAIEKIRQAETPPAVDADDDPLKNSDENVAGPWSGSGR